MSSPAESALCAIEKSTAIPLIDFAKQVVQKIYESDEITSIVCDAIKKQNYEDTDDLLDDIEDRNNSILMYMISKAIENTQSIVYKWNNEDSNNLCEILTKIYRDDVTDVNQYNKVVSKSGDVNTLMFTSVDDALSYYDRQLNAVFELHPSTMTTETSVNSVTNNMLKSKSKIIKQTKERNDIKAREANQKRQNQQNKQNVGENIPQPNRYKQNQTKTHNKYDNNTCFYHIEKSGSSSIAGMLHVYNFNTSYTSENALFHCQCGFTFVRDPISRFVSGYYTINKLIYWFHHHLPRIGKKGANMDKVPRLFSFWNITGEPQRMMEFVNNIYDSSFEFTKITPLEHMMTQSGLLGVSSADIHYIGRVSDLMEHLDVIKNKCAIRTDNKFLLETDLIEQRIMTRFGTKWFDELRPWYTDMLSLDDYVKGDLDPAYLAIADNYDLYYKIVEFYKQDYVCFGFEHDWVKFRAKVYEKLNKTLLRKKKKRLNDTHVLIRNGLK
eukprot:29898_1